MSFSRAINALNRTLNRTFGINATYNYLDSSPSSSIYGVFDNAFIEINNVATKKPIFKNVNLSDLSAEPVEGDTLVINSVTYTIVGHEPDSFGTTTLILEGT